ncbi:restriction endonuclease subunit S [Haloimpatiens sp. FM7315]|uniref:restriction endonuclease subunit S n=1 Tax=Haloimpatiens sp. FM7315 TaxID=3298609 RepID=UPI0035A3C72A
MALNKVKIGTFVEKYSEKCGIPNLTVNDISGINRDKEFFEPSKQVGANTSGYSVVPPNYFACNLMHVGRDVVLPISMNHTKKNKIVSPAYTVFRITDETVILKEYFFMCLKSNEKDRFFWFNTDSSVRDGMEWGVFCDVELTLPSVDIQKKYVAIYKAIQKNISTIKSGIDKSDYVCHVQLDKILHSMPLKSISSYIEQTDQRNNNMTYGEDSVKGMTITKEVIPTKANVSTTDLSNFLVVKPLEFVYNPRTHGKKIGLGFNLFDSPFIISWNNTAFRIKPEKTKELLPEYLYLCFCRDEWDRAACFRSWGSSTEVFTWESLCETEIAIPSIEMQKDIVDIYKAYIERKNILEKLIEIEKTICPILISGAIKEGDAK